MEVPGTGRARSDAGKRDALLTLKSRSFPGRVRAILETLLGQLAPLLEQGMVDTLDAFEQSLFRRAEQARSNDVQQSCFESLREVRRVRSDIAPALMARFESALAALNDPRRQSSLARPQRAGRSDLALVEASELEESLALVEAANRAEVRASQALFALGMRFAVLAEAPMFEAEDLPIGPHRLSECVRLASEHLELPTEHRILFYRAVDQMLFARVDRLIEEANRVLIESRVLADLFVLNTRSRRNEDGHHKPARDHLAQATPQSVGKAPNAHDADIGLGTTEPVHPTEPAPRPVAAAPEAMRESAPQATSPSAPPAGSSESNARFPQRAQQTRFGLATPAATRLVDAETGDSGRYGGFARPMTGWPGVPAALPREPAVNDGQDRQVFQTMRDLLSGRRESLGLSAAPAPDPNAFPARSDDLQSVLGVLQKKPAFPQSVGGKLVPRSIGHVKQDILNQLRQVTPEGRIPRLHEEDADTIDLVGLLFENLAKQATPNATVSQLMTKLQVPLLRVALRDKSFFSRRSHPARQLLNAVAESGLYWLDEGEEDRQLVDKMQGVVDHVLQEFQDDAGVFEQVLGDLSRHLQTQARKSEVAERRHVDAARGREKLESARHTAAAAISSRIGTYKPRALIRTLLEQAWTDVLALTVLRQGEDSPIYRERLAFVDDLVAFGRGAAAHTTPQRRDAMRAALESGLSQIGFHVEDIQAVGSRLFGAQHGAGAANDDPATLTEVAAQLKARSRFGEEGDHHAHLRAQVPHVDPPLGGEELKLLTQLKSLPFGTWFEITMPGQKQPSRRKLSWFSTLTGRCLFVNQRGARSHETSLEQLARDLHEQHAKVYEEPQENLIDRAWHAIVRKLKSLAGQSAADAAEAT
ncbi:MAG: DUF1631 domain-containing protein [Xanthomonadales bacterium]|nr:DUF1631 domain-containing protein [Xanthomonadales bacterium]MBK7144508.1 DUF1631 domain-containing protein [Xanthomonadales bacterium]MCC6561145.1 DUF1631 domain-containing protein [Xanthomonadales bacterium]